MEQKFNFKNYDGIEDKILFVTFNTKRFFETALRTKKTFSQVLKCGSTTPPLVGNVSA